MATFADLSPDSDLSDVPKLFPRNSDRLLRLLNNVMCDQGALTRGQRETIAAYVSEQNATPYCVFYHTLFSRVFSDTASGSQGNIQPLLDFSRALSGKSQTQITGSFHAALAAGWTEAALYETVEVCSMFEFINTIIQAADLAAPTESPVPAPTRDALQNSYASMADALRD